MIGMSGTAQIVEAIRQDGRGMGYVSSGYLVEQLLQNLKVIKIKADAQTPAYSPLDSEMIIGGKYPITRPLLQYTDGKPTGTLLAFIRYQFTEEGAQIIQSNGFYPVDPATQAQKL